jgi:hypothetical protein
MRKMKMKRRRRRCFVTTTTTTMMFVWSVVTIWKKLEWKFVKEEE